MMTKMMTTMIKVKVHLRFNETLAFALHMNFHYAPPGTCKAPRAKVAYYYG